MFSNITSQKVSDQIMDQIKQKIRNGELCLGDKLPSERQMCEELGVSRAAVREALHSMSVMGFVESRQGDGNYISSSIENSFVESLSIAFILNQGKKEEIFQLRRALELEAVRLAARTIDEAPLRRMRDFINVNLTSDDGEAKKRAYEGFFMEIAYASKNTFIIALLSSLWQVHREQMVHVAQRLISSNNRQKVLERQEQILEAMAAHDVELAVESVKTHLDIMAEWV